VDLPFRIVAALSHAPLPKASAHVIEGTSSLQIPLTASGWARMYQQKVRCAHTHQDDAASTQMQFRLILTGCVGALPIILMHLAGCMRLVSHYSWAVPPLHLLRLPLGVQMPCYPCSEGANIRALPSFCSQPSSCTAKHGIGMCSERDCLAQSQSL
jgi:hypothetical protein